MIDSLKEFISPLDRLAVKPDAPSIRLAGAIFYAHMNPSIGNREKCLFDLPAALKSSKGTTQ